MGMTEQFQPLTMGQIKPDTPCAQRLEKQGAQASIKAKNKVQYFDFQPI